MNQDIVCNKPIESRINSQPVMPLTIRIGINHLDISYYIREENCLITYQPVLCPLSERSTFHIRIWSLKPPKRCLGKKNIPKKITVIASSHQKKHKRPCSRRDQCWPCLFGCHDNGILVARQQLVPGKIRRVCHHATMVTTSQVLCHILPEAWERCVGWWRSRKGCWEGSVPILGTNQTLVAVNASEAKGHVFYVFTFILVW